MFNRKIWAMCVAAVTLTTTPAFAQQYRTVSQTVSFADLDLATKAGMRALDLRIAKAAYHVCSDGQDMSIDNFDNVESCVNGARAVSRTKIAGRMARNFQAASSR